MCVEWIEAEGTQGQGARGIEKQTLHLILTSVSADDDDDYFIYHGSPLLCPGFLPPSNDDGAKTQRPS